MTFDGLRCGVWSAAAVDAIFCGLCVVSLMPALICAEVAHNLLRADACVRLLFVAAPVVYVGIWKGFKFRVSPGRTWVFLERSEKVESPLRRIVCELVVGVLATILGAIAMFPACYILNLLYPSEGLPGPLAYAVQQYKVVSAMGLFPILYCCMLAVVNNYRYGLSLDVSEAETKVDMTAPRLVRSCSPRMHFVVLMATLPVLLTLGAVLCFPRYFQPLLSSPVVSVLVAENIFCNLAGLLILYCWDSPRAFLFYGLFFVVPLPIIFSSLPAFASIVQIH